jgi:hypothetical protein
MSICCTWINLVLSGRVPFSVAIATIASHPLCPPNELLQFCKETVLQARAMLERDASHNDAPLLRAVIDEASIAWEHLISQRKPHGWVLTEATATGEAAANSRGDKRQGMTRPLRTETSPFILTEAIQ